MSDHKLDNVELPADSVLATCTAPVNIAVIKYWGKKDEKLIIPINGSLSATIDQGTMRSLTTVVASKAFKEDTMILNGKPDRLTDRIQTVIEQIRKRAGDLKEGNRVLVAKNEWPQYKLRIVSSNNFPTAAGLASSASGLACLTKCLAELHNVTEAFEGELTTIARQGSGSACRSLHSGWVKWLVGGHRPDGTDSLAKQVAPDTHWPEMRVLILVANSGPKGVSSTTGMETSVETSELLKFRAEHVVEKRMKAMEEAILARDFDKFGVITMQDSNQFHATCLDTYPPIFYLNDISKRIIAVVHAINESAGRIVVAYTFDAGPNAVLYVLAKDMDAVLRTMLSYFMPAEQEAKLAQGQSLGEYITDPLQLAQDLTNFRRHSLLDAESDKRVQRNPAHTCSRFIVSKVGEGAKLVEKRHSFNNRSQL